MDKYHIKILLFILFEIYLSLFYVNGGNNDEIQTLTSHLITNFITKEEFIRECRQKLSIYRPNLSETQVYFLCIKALISSLEEMEKNPENRIAGIDQIPKEASTTKKDKKEYGDNKRGFKKLLKDVTDIFSSDIFFFDDILELDNSLFSDSILNFFSEYKFENVESKQIESGVKDEIERKNNEKGEDVSKVYPEAYYPLAVEILTTMGIEDVNIWIELPTKLELSVLIYYLFNVIKKGNKYEECDRHKFFINSIISIVKNNKELVFPKNKTLQDIRYSLCKLGYLYKVGTSLSPFSIILSLPKHSYDIWKSFGLILQFEVLIALSKSILYDGKIDMNDKLNLFEETKIKRLKKEDEKNIQDYLLNTLSIDETIPTKHFRSVMNILLKSSFGKRSVYFSYKDNPFSLLNSDFGFPDKRDELTIKRKNREKERDNHKEELIKKMKKLRKITEKNKSDSKDGINKNKENEISDDQIEIFYGNEDVKGETKKKDEKKFEGKKEENEVEEKKEVEKDMEESKKGENEVEEKKEMGKRKDEKEIPEKEEEELKNEIISLIHKVNNDNIKEMEEKKMDIEEIRKENSDKNPDNNEQNSNIENKGVNDELLEDSEKNMNSGVNQKTELEHESNYNNNGLLDNEALIHKEQNEIKSQVLEEDEHEKDVENDAELNNEDISIKEVDNQIKEEKSEDRHENNEYESEKEDEHENEKEDEHENEKEDEHENEKEEEHENEKEEEHENEKEEEHENEKEEEHENEEEEEHENEKEDEHENEKEDEHENEKEDEHENENEKEEEHENEKEEERENEKEDEHENNGDDINENIETVNKVIEGNIKNDNEQENVENPLYEMDDVPESIDNNINNNEIKELNSEKYLDDNFNVDSVDDSLDNGEGENKQEINKMSDDDINNETMKQDVNNEPYENDELENSIKGGEMNNQTMDEEGEFEEKETREKSENDDNDKVGEKNKLEDASKEEEKEDETNDKFEVEKIDNDDDISDTETKQNNFNDNEFIVQKENLKNEKLEKNNEVNTDEPYEKDFNSENDDNFNNDLGIKQQSEVDEKYTIWRENDTEEERKVILKNVDTNDEDKYKKFLKEQNEIQGPGNQENDNIDEYKNSVTQNNESNIDFYPVSQGEESDEEDDDQIFQGENNKISHGTYNEAKEIDFYPMSQGEESDEEEVDDIVEAKDSLIPGADNNENSEVKLKHSWFKEEKNQEEPFEFSKEPVNEEKQYSLSTDINYKHEKEHNIEKIASNNDVDSDLSEEDEIKVMEDMMNKNNVYKIKSDQDIKSTVDSEEFSSEDELLLAGNDFNLFGEKEANLPEDLRDSDKEFDLIKKNIYGNNFEFNKLKNVNGNSADFNPKTTSNLEKDLGVNEYNDDDDLKPTNVLKTSLNLEKNSDTDDEYEKRLKQPDLDFGSELDLEKGLGIDGDNNSNLNSKPELPDLDFGPELDLEKGLGIDGDNNSNLNSKLGLPDLDFGSELDLEKGLGIDGDNNSNLNSKPELPDLDFGPELDLEKGLGIDGDNNSNLNSKPELPDLDFGPELDLEKGLGIENNNFDTSSRVNFVLNQEILQNDSADEWDGYTDEIKLLEESLENKNRNYYLFDDIASTVDQESESDLYDNELLVVNNSPINENIKDESIDFELKINNNNEKILEGPAGLDLTVKSDRNVQITDDDMKMINEIIDGTVTNSETSNNEEDLFIGQLYENSDETNINDVEKSIKNKDKNVDDDDLGISNLFVNKPNNQKNNEINDLDNDILHLDLLFESEKDSDKSDHDNLDENLELNLLFDDTDKYKKKTFNDNEEDDDNIIDISNLFLLEDKINNKFDEDYSNINESDTKLTDEEVEVINQVIMNTKIDPNYDNKLEESFTDFKISSQISKSAVRQSQNMYNSDTEYHINDDDDDIDISDTFLFDIKDNFFTQNPIDGFKNKEEKFELSEGDFLLLDEIIEETNKQQLELLTPEDNMLLNSNDFIEGSYAKKAVLVNSKSNTNVVNLRGSINTISIENNVRKANIIKRPVNSDIKQVKSPSIEDYSVKLKKVNGENEEKNEHDREREWIFSFAPKLRPGRMEGRRDLFTEEEIQRAKREAANLE